MISTNCPRRRDGLIRLCCSLVGMLCMVSASGLVSDAQQDPVAGIEEGLLVLDSGMVMQGKITPGHDSYTVAQAAGKIVVPMERVRFRCDTLKDAYVKLREGLPENKTAASHLDLARWCIRYRLFSEARVELTTALEIEPDREEVRQMLRRLDELLNPGADSASTQPAPRRKFTLEELQPLDVESLGGLSRSAALQFSRQIQPILLNNCGSASCHGRTASNEFRLSMVRPEPGMKRHLVEQNLAAVLRYVNLDDPASSSLLTVPQGNHGPRGRTLFQGPKGTEQVQLLRKWVEGLQQEKNLGSSLASKSIGSHEEDPPEKKVVLASNETKEAPRNKSEGVHPLLRVGPKAPPIRAPEQSMPEKKVPPRRAPDSKPRTTAKAVKPKRIEEPQEIEQPAVVEEPDPFDPEAFNRETSRRMKRR